MLTGVAQGLLAGIGYLVTGMLGLLIGPVVMALAISTLRIYAAETQGRHAEGEARR